ncbi:MAG TPA: ECF-type sigma factor [Lacipirellulaceae bacterium]|nr:ECF-type sigma factor [Lacipirellulaceae bacterium]
MDDSVTEWIGRLKSGDEEAIEKLWHRYSVKLAELARTNLNGLPKSVSDEEDIAQSVFHSICRGAAAGRFVDLSSRAELWWLLLAITRQKTVNRLRHDTAQKRGNGRVETESALKDRLQGSKPFNLDNLINSDPSPDFLLMLEEEYQALLGSLRDDKLRLIAILRVEGYTVAEIAERLEISTRAVERKLHGIRIRWAHKLPTRDDCDDSRGDDA